MPNRLADEQSPYLLQHKDNPVDWYPWGEAAFEKAKAEDRPVFLSIGYSTCHWCHVMEHESFEDETVAERMNDTFVSIKVDREERPDIDSLYMRVCQMMTRRGGWPLNVVLTPDKKPFYATTYLPKEGRMGRMGLLDLIDRVEELWTEQRDEVLDEANGVTDALKQIARQASDSAPIGSEVLDAAYEQLADRYDPAHGGFGDAPKFPSPHTLLFLLRHAHRTGLEKPREMVAHTLQAMRLGGLFDHVGFGFHRYSTDARWLLPHFEKMLYDQALLLMAYVEGYQMTGDPLLAQTAREIGTYVLRDLRDEAGGFYSAEDADSEDEHGASEEGAFYVWRTDEVRDVLDDDLADVVIAVYNLEEEGNYHDESTRQPTGKNILHLETPLDQVAESRGEDPEALRDRLEAARRQLFARREDRPRPGLDDKVLTDWNGLMIAALAQAGRVLEEPDFEAAAAEAAHFILDALRDEDSRLLHRYRNGDAAIRAHADDYAFLVWGLIELYQTTFEAEWLGEALCLTDEFLDHFWDETQGAFYLTADDGEQLIVRQKELQDNAIPSANSVAFYNMLRLARLTGHPRLEKQADALSRYAAEQVKQYPSGFTGLLIGQDFAEGPAQEVVIAGQPDAHRTQAFLQHWRAAYAPRTVALLRPPQNETVPTLAPFTEAHAPVDGQAAAYICQDFQCQAPTTDPDALADALHGSSTHPTR